MDKHSKSILAVDVGKIRVGLALKKSGTNVIFPFGVVNGGKTGLQQISSTVIDENVDEVVVGMPVLLSGEEGLQAEHVKKWIIELKKHIQVPIKTIDERFSTRGAKNLKSGAKNLKIGKNSKSAVSIDEMAAMDILKAYAGIL